MKRSKQQKKNERNGIKMTLSIFADLLWLSTLQMNLTNNHYLFYTFLFYFAASILRYTQVVCVCQVASLSPITITLSVPIHSRNFNCACCWCSRLFALHSNKYSRKLIEPHPTGQTKRRKTANFQFQMVSNMQNGKI